MPLIVTLKVSDGSALLGRITSAIAVSSLPTAGASTARVTGSATGAITRLVSVAEPEMACTGAPPFGSVSMVSACTWISKLPATFGAALKRTVPNASIGICRGVPV